MKKIITITFLVLNIWCTISYSQSIEKSIQELDSYFLQVMQDWRIPSMAIGVVKGSEIVFLKGYGYRDIDSKIPVDENTLFPISGSIENNFLNASINVLQKQGKINPKEPLKNFLPNFRMYNEYVTENVTLHDFMTSKTGLPSHGFLFYGTDYSRSHIIDVLEYIEPVTEFRDHKYTMLSPYVIKYAVDNTSETSYENFVHESLFEPLEMNSSCFGFEYEKKGNVALPYSFNNDTGTYELEMEEFKYILNLYNTKHDPGVFSSAKDLCHWIIMSLNEGKFRDKQIVSSDFISQTQSLQVPSGQSNYSSGNINLGMSYGSFIDYFHGHHLVSSYGHKGMFDSRLMLFPQDSIGIIVLTGSTNSGRWIIGEVIAEKLILGKHKDWNKIGLDNPRWVKEMEERPKPVRPSGLNKEDLPSLNLHAYTGKFVNNGYGEITIREENGTLKGKRSVTQYELDHISKDQFKIHVGDTFLNFKTMQFHVNENGKVNKLSVDFESSLPPIEFTRVK